MPADPGEGDIPAEVPAATEATPKQAPVPAVTPWRLRDLGFFLAFALFGLLVSNLLVLTGYVALAPVVGWRTPPQALQGNPFFLLTLQCVFYALIFLYIYALVVVNYRRPFWATLNWKKPTSRQAVRFFLGGGLLAIAVRFAPTILPDAESFPLERLFTSPAAAYAIAAFAVLVAPFMEELTFRGVLFSIFERQVGPHFAIVSTAVLFAALHIPEYWGAWNHVFLIFLVGVVFSWARGQTGSLVPSVILHLAYNASMMTLLFFETQHFRALRLVFSP